MEHQNHIIQAAGTIRNQVDGMLPHKAVILGSGLSDWANTLEEKTVLDVADIPHWPKPTVSGHRGTVVIGHSDGEPVIALQGRLHAYEGLPARDVVFPIRVLGALDVTHLIVTHAGGGLNPAFHAGDLMLVTDHINLMGTNPLVGVHDARWGDRFPDMSQPYDLNGRNIALSAARDLDIPLHQGVLAAVLGPSYETAAEVRMLKTLGCDAVCMSTVPEVIAAVQMGMRVLGLSAIANPATGLSSQSLSHGKIADMSKKILTSLSPLLARILARWGEC